jgi:chemotaxis signal transduction protein
MIRDVMSVMRVDVGAMSLAMDASTVQEVLGATDVVAIPGPRGLVGVMAWDGRALVVVDLAPFIAADSDVKRPRTLIVNAFGSTVAVPIDRAYEPVESPTVREAHAMRLAFARSEVDIDGATFPLFDVEALLAALDRDHA